MLGDPRDPCGYHRPVVCCPDTETTRVMILAGLFAAILFLGLILGDWLYFVRLTPDAGRYGCGIARTVDRFSAQSLMRLEASVDADGALALPHGIARYYPDLRQIAYARNTDYSLSAFELPGRSKGL